MRILRTMTAFAAALSLAACATPPDQIAARSVSTLPFQSLTCNQLMTERNQVVESVNTLTAAQKKKASNDAVAMGVGMVLFWPALFALSAGSNQEDALAEAKGQYEAIDAAQKARGCIA